MLSLTKWLALLFICGTAQAAETILTWIEPTQNDDGTLLTDLTSYEIWHGCTESGVYDVVDVILAPATTYTVIGLSGTCYFAAKATNSQGVSSVYSGEVVRAFGLDVPGVITNTQITWQASPVMAFPTIRSTIGDISPIGTDHTVTLPATIVSGDLILAFVSTDGNRTYDWDSASAIGTWTTLYDANDGGGNVKGGAFAIIADGTEGGATLNFNLSGSEPAQWRVHVIQDWEGTLSGITTGTAVGGSGTTADAPSVTAAGGSGDNLFFAILARDDKSNGVATVYPYADNQYSDVGTTSGSGLAASSSANIAAATDNPSTVFEWDGLAEQYVVNTIVIEPAAGGSASLSIPVAMHQYARLRNN